MSAADHLERVHEIPCVVCVKMGLQPKFPVTAHHLESVRDALSDYAAVALCHEHHQGKNGIHGLSRRGFEMKYKLSELDLLKMTLWLLDKYGHFK